MKKLVHSLGLMVAIATTSMLAGCDLYFGNHDNGSSTWNYCGSDGYYQCHGDSCTWVSATCPQAGSGTTSGSGYTCSTNTDCAAGCYCANGTCTEGGFCAVDADCGSGYHCDTSRSSCEPNPPTATCNYDKECPTGQYCAPDHTCTATCTCTNDQQALNQGYGWCDETRQTCLPGQDPAGTCAGVPADTCTSAEPVCPSGQVPTLIDGCFNGQCRDYAACDLPPVCEHINDESNCLARSTDCAASYTGINCHKPDGTACHSGDSNCTCQSFQFATCSTRPK